MHPLLGDPAQLREGEDLKTSTVGQDRAIPSHEPMQAAEFLDHLLTRTDMEVIGIPENDLRTHRAKLVGRDRLHRRLGADRHEDRCLDITPAGMQNPGTRLARQIGVKKGERSHGIKGDTRLLG